MKQSSNKISVIVCAYTYKRWEHLKKCIKALQSQSRLPDEIILVIDHNPELFAESQEVFKQIQVIENNEQRGLSGARNSALKLVSGDIIAFIDEDAEADHYWLEKLEGPFEDPKVMGVGGFIDPNWEEGSRPGWFPREFDWVVGCSYLGLPKETDEVRNLIGCNMSYRVEAFKQLGGFTDGIGRVGTHPVGCEETEFCIRVGQKLKDIKFIYQPDAIVYHFVPEDRSNLKYFLSRCYYEGISKAAVAQLTGPKDGLSSERTYTTKVLPLGVLKGFADLFRLDFAGPQRAISICLGLFYTVWGYVAGKITIRREAASHQKASVSAPVGGG